MIDDLLDLGVDAVAVFDLIPMFVHVIVAILLAGFGRAMVGDGAWSRGLVYPVTCGYAAWVGFGFTWWALAFAVVTGLTLSSGRTDWSNKPFMAFRYAIGPLILTGAYVWIMGSPSSSNTIMMMICLSAWVICCALVGLFYSTIQEAFAEDETNWLFDPAEVDSSRIAEFIAGCVIQGAPALMRYALPT